MTSGRVQTRRLVRAGWGIVLGACVPAALWLSWAPLAMAVVAPAVVTVDLYRRPVQHREGGIVRRVLVRNGQQVKAGDAVVELGDVSVDADRNRLRYRVDVERAALARLDAEQALAPRLVLPEDLRTAAAKDSRVAEAVAKETALFDRRREALTSELGLMRSHRQRIEQEIATLHAQITNAERSLSLQESELDVNRRLVREGLVAAIRVVQVEAAVRDYAAKLEERRTDLARAEQRLVETELRMTSVQNDYLRVASDQLKVTNARLAEIEQELRKSEDAAARLIVAAPVGGEVIDLKVTSPGAVIRAGDLIAEIVPTEATLMIEARIRTEDVNHVHRGQPARIRFTAFRFRSTAMVTGAVTYVSADRLVDRTLNIPYYTVLITADPASLHAAGDLTLQAGMPAEVYLEGTTQTALQYLIEPITRTIRRAGREI